MGLALRYRSKVFGLRAVTWGSMPEEILRIILKHATLETLMNCMTVSKRWKNIVLDYIEFNSLWPQIFSETMVNGGRTYRRKSILSYKDMLMTSKLWRYIPIADIRLHHTYELDNITSIQVYKEQLIMTTDTQTERPIKYYDMTNAEITRTMESTVGEIIEAAENDYMVVFFGHEFVVYGKQRAGDTILSDHCRMYAMAHILSYRLEDNVCYIVNERHLVWALTWDRTNWYLVSRGRYYGSSYDPICGINVYNKKVWMVTRLGFVLCEDPKTHAYNKVNSRNIVPKLENSNGAVLFNELTVVLSVNHKDERVTLGLDRRSELLWLECGHMTCATEHGEVLFIGYEDGTVAICRPHILPYFHGEFSRVLNVQDFDKSIENPSVLAIEVFEDKLSHHLLVATAHKVLQLLITYPGDVTMYYK